MSIEDWKLAVCNYEGEDLCVELKVSYKSSTTSLGNQLLKYSTISWSTPVYSVKLMKRETEYCGARVFISKVYFEYNAEGKSMAMSAFNKIVKEILSC